MYRSLIKAHPAKAGAAKRTGLKPSLEMVMPAEPPLDTLTWFTVPDIGTWDFVGGRYPLAATSGLYAQHAGACACRRHSPALAVMRNICFAEVISPGS